MIVAAVVYIVYLFFKVVIYFMFACTRVYLRTRTFMLLYTWTCITFVCIVLRSMYVCMVQIMYACTRVYVYVLFTKHEERIYYVVGSMYYVCFVLYVCKLQIGDKRHAHG